MLQRQGVLFGGEREVVNGLTRVQFDVAFP